MLPRISGDVTGGVLRRVAAETMSSCASFAYVLRRDRPPSSLGRVAGFRSAVCNFVSWIATWDHASTPL